MADQPDSPRVLTAPLGAGDVEPLRAGDRVLVSGVVYTARDAAHKRLVAAIESGGRLPFSLPGQIIYYVGPSPAPPGQVIGAAGPTTSSRMDPYAARLYAAGIKATIGKGPRSPEVREAIRRHQALYLATIGGAGALLARTIVQAEVLAFPELGPEAVWRLVVEGLPAVVANDAHGGDIYEMVRQRAAEGAGP